MFTLRTATEQDIAAVDRMLARAYLRLLKADYAPSTLAMAMPLISRAQPALLTSGTYYLVEEDDTLLGAGGWTVASPGTGTITHGVGHIRHVATDDRAIRRGVARALMDHIFNAARQQGVRRMDCLSTLTAVPFYKAVGFEKIRNTDVSLGPALTFPAVEMICPL